MYKNIIFDIGNVLLKFNPKEYLIKNFEKTKVNTLYNIIFQSKEWIMLDRGTLSNSEALNIFISKSIENKNLITSAFENWTKCLSPIDVNVKALKKLKNHNYKLFYLSNFHETAFKEIIKTYDFFNLFDGGIVSYKENIIKPEEGIYKKLTKKYNIEPYESLFIDDSEINIKTAQNLNFNTIHFTGNENLNIQLKL